MADPTIAEMAQTAAPGAAAGLTGGSLIAFLQDSTTRASLASAATGGLLGALAYGAAREWLGLGFWTALLAAAGVGVCAVPLVLGLRRAAESVAADPLAIVQRFFPFKSGGK